ncbi:MAG: prokaryotic E2 ligase family D protein, partial [Chloroflexi bacterium]|nr:prokaryotic E2 ligase family D protein [Chloroflexota bacterium]
VEAAVFFMQDQLMFCQRDHGDRLKPLSLQTLRAAVSEAPLDSGWLPPGLVRCGQSAHGPWAVLWVPPGKHTVMLADEQIETPLPGFVLYGHGARYWVFALAACDFRPDARLYDAPLPNVHADGAICWGGNRPPEAQPSQMCAAWQLFMSSPFNGDLSQGKSRAAPQDVRALLRHLQREGARDYPLDDLQPLGQLTVAAGLMQVLNIGGYHGLEG